MLRRYLPPSLCISTYIYIYICTSCTHRVTVRRASITRLSKRIGRRTNEAFTPRGYRSRNFPRRCCSTGIDGYCTRSSAVKEERRRRRVIIELRHDNIDRESGNGNSRGRINRYQFVPLPLAFPPEFSSSITGTVIVICRLSAIAISRCSRILSIFLSISKMLRPKMVNLSERDRKNGRIVARPPTPVPKIYRRRNEREDRVTRPKIVLVKPRDF